MTERDLARAFGCRLHDDGTVSEVIDVDDYLARAYREDVHRGDLERIAQEVDARGTWTCRACGGAGGWKDESIPPQPFGCTCCAGMGVHWPGERCEP